MLRKYWYIIKNSYKEANHTIFITMLIVLKPLLGTYALLLFYQHIINPTQQGSNISNLNIYFLFILVVGCVELPLFSDAIRKEIINETYLNIERLPFNPFIYYFFKSIGKNCISLLILSLSATGYMIYQHVSPVLIAIFIPAIFIGFILSHLIFFLFTCFIFYSEQVNVWLFRIIFDFTSGRLFPLGFAPVWIEKFILNVLPFSYAFGALARDFSRGNIHQAFISLGVASLWSIVLFFLATKLWHKGSYYFQENG